MLTRITLFAVLFSLLASFSIAGEIMFQLPDGTDQDILPIMDANIKKVGGEAGLSDELLPEGLKNICVYNLLVLHIMDTTRSEADNIANPDLRVFALYGYPGVSVYSLTLKDDAVTVEIIYDTYHEQEVCINRIPRYSRNSDGAKSSVWTQIVLYLPDECEYENFQSVIDHLGRKEGSGTSSTTRGRDVGQ